MTAWDRVVVVLLGAAGFALSYDALRAIAVAIHVRAELTYVFPVVIDGFIAYGVRALVVLRYAQWRARFYAWMLFSVATTASIWANAMHAVKLNEMGQATVRPPWTPPGLAVSQDAPPMHLGDLAVAILSMMAPLALAGSVHLYIIMAREAEEQTTEPMPQPAAVAEHLERSAPLRMRWSRFAVTAGAAASVAVVAFAVTAWRSGSAGALTAAVAAPLAVVALRKTGDKTKSERSGALLPVKVVRLGTDPGSGGAEQAYRAITEQLDDEQAPPSSALPDARSAPIDISERSRTERSGPAPEGTAKTPDTGQNREPAVEPAPAEQTAAAGNDGGQQAESTPNESKNSQKDQKRHKKATTGSPVLEAERNRSEATPASGNKRRQFAALLSRLVEAGDPRLNDEKTRTDVAYELAGQVRPVLRSAGTARRYMLELLPELRDSKTEQQAARSGARETERIHAKRTVVEAQVELERRRPAPLAKSAPLRAKERSRRVEVSVPGAADAVLLDVPEQERSGASLLLHVARRTEQVNGAEQTRRSLLPA